jgi:hypothetical protein
MKVARYEVTGQVRSAWNRQRIWPRALNYACRISRLPRIRRPFGTRPFFVCYPGNKLPGYYREVPPGQETYPASLISAKLALMGFGEISRVARFIQSLRDEQNALVFDSAT